MTQRSLHVSVTGLVQGVAFRWWTRETAGELGLAGWVRNLPDGRVELEASGPRDVLDEFLVRLRRGPAQAQVTDLRVTELGVSGGRVAEGVDGFEIRR